MLFGLKTFGSISCGEFIGETEVISRLDDLFYNYWLFESRIKLNAN